MSSLHDAIGRITDEVLSLGKLDVINEVFTDDFVMHGPAGPLDRVAFRYSIADLRHTVPDLRATIERSLAEGDLGAFVIRMTGTFHGVGAGRAAGAKHLDVLFPIVVAADGEGRATEAWSESAAFQLRLQMGVWPEASAT